MLPVIKSAHHVFRLLEWKPITVSTRLNEKMFKHTTLQHLPQVVLECKLLRILCTTLNKAFTVGTVGIERVAGIIFMLVKLQVKLQVTA